MWRDSGKARFTVYGARFKVYGSRCMAVGDLEFQISNLKYNSLGLEPIRHLSFKFYSI